MNTVIYHCWFEAREPQPYCNLRTPVILSIASLRSVFSGPIHVIDLSDEPKDWSYFPKKLNFSVSLRTGAYKRYAGRIRGWKYLSRILDVNACASEKGFDNIVYSDTDVFWLRSPTATSERFSFDGFNSGFYYYKISNSSKFVNLFNKYSIAAITSDCTREEFTKYCGYNAWYGVWDEMILPYMLEKHPNLFEICRAVEHVTTRSLGKTNPDELGMFHANSSSLINPHGRSGGDPAHSPGVYALAIKEIYEQVQKVLNDDDLETIFTPYELDYFKNRQFSLVAIRKLLCRGARAGSPWHTELDCFLPGITRDRGLIEQAKHAYWMTRHRIRHARSLIAAS